jgi:hypothetical protein
MILVHKIQIEIIKKFYYPFSFLKHFVFYRFQKLYQKWEIIYNNYNLKVYDEYYDVTNIIQNVINKMM